MLLLEKLKERYEVKATSDPDEVRICCMFCNDTKFHLYISLRKRVCFCQRCNVTVPLYKLLSSRLSVQPRVEPKPKEDTTPPKVDEIPFGSVPAFANSEALEYLESRGFSLDEIKRFELMYCSLGRFAHRIIIPIHSDGCPSSFIGRTIIDAEPKYLYPRGFKKSFYLFNFQPARLVDRPVVLVEGCFDAMRLGDIGVAILGSHLSDIQACILRQGLSKGHKVVIMLDPDARIKSLHIAEKLKDYFDVYMCWLKSKDPAETDRESLKRLIEGAKRYSFGMWKEILQREEVIK